MCVSTSLTVAVIALLEGALLSAKAPFGQADVNERRSERQRQYIASYL